MTSLKLSLFGPPEQKHVVKVPPMQTLKDALVAASTKFKPALDAAICQLHLNKKPVDLDTPFRLLNIPAGSKLEVIKKAPTGPNSTPAAAASAAASIPVATAQPTTVPATAAAAQPLSLTQQQGQAVHTLDTPSTVQPAPVQTKQVAFAQEQSPAAVSAAVSDQAAAGDTSPPPVVTAAAAAEAAAAQTTSTAAVPPQFSVLGIQRHMYVFHQRVLEAAAAAAQSTSAMDVDPPDEFFELTAEDLARLQQQANAKKQQEAVFRTRAAREAEEARAAAAMGPVRVRLHWPDGTLLQAEFKATEPLAQVQDLVRKCAAPQYAPAIYLYTTPPKTVLNDAAATLYHLQLVPAAHIYVGVDDKKVAQTVHAAGSTAEGPETQGNKTFLRPEVQALMQDHVPESQQQRQQDGGADNSSAATSEAAAVAAAQRALRAAAAGSRSEAAGGDAAGSKVPKWLKVGKK